MSKFNLRLRELRTDRRLSQQELADILKISKSSVNMYERGEREPGINMLELIADYFNVDMDYLTGKKDKKTTYHFNTPRTTGERIKCIRNMRNITQRDFGIATNIDIDKVISYEMGKMDITKEQLSKIADTLDVPISIFDIDDKTFEYAVNSDFDEFCGMMIAHEESFALGSTQPPDFLDTYNDFNSEEIDHIKKYRSLDNHGRKIIDYCLNEEYDRCVAAQTEQEEPEIISIKFAHLPASAGTGIDLSEENYSSLKVKANDLTRSADFAVRVSGDSMEPTYNDGDILLVEQLPINIGDIGIFILNGDGYVKEFGGDRLISHNKKYPDIKLSEHDVIMCPGRVIGVLEEDDYET